MLWYCAAALLFLTLAGARLCYRMAFSVPKQREVLVRFLKNQLRHTPAKLQRARPLRV